VRTAAGPGRRKRLSLWVAVLRAAWQAASRVAARHIWHGAPVSLTVAAPRGARTAVLLQDDRGAILAAAVLR